MTKAVIKEHRGFYKLLAMITYMEDKNEVTADELAYHLNFRGDRNGKSRTPQDYHKEHARRNGVMPRGLGLYMDKFPNLFVKCDSVIVKGANWKCLWKLNKRGARAYVRRLKRDGCKV